jgi:hypothetical protein
MLDLAPRGVCLADIVTNIAGALLPHRFTITYKRLSILCGTFRHVTMPCR